MTKNTRHSYSSQTLARQKYGLSKFFVKVEDFKKRVAVLYIFTISKLSVFIPCAFVTPIVVAEVRAVCYLYLVFVIFKAVKGRLLLVVQSVQGLAVLVAGLGPCVLTLGPCVLTLGPRVAGAGRRRGGWRGWQSWGPVLHIRL